MRRRRATLALVAVTVALAACGDHGGSSSPTTSVSASTSTPTTVTTPTTVSPTTVPPTTSDPSGHDHHGGDQTMDPADQAAAMRATASFQDTAVAERSGYASSLDSLGCFQDPTQGGMGVHYIDQSLLDDQVDITEPEALVYELDADGQITGLVAHEYIVPIDAWTSSTPPALFGIPFHRHPTLPLWVLHTWLWKPNPAGMFTDWNPAVRLCPPGVPIFGVDLPKPATTESTGPSTTPPSTAPVDPAVAASGDPTLVRFGRR